MAMIKVTIDTNVLIGGLDGTDQERRVFQALWLTNDNYFSRRRQLEFPVGSGQGLASWASTNRVGVRP